MANYNAKRELPQPIKGTPVGKEEGPETVYYSSIAESAKGGFTPCLISMALRGKRKQHGGYIWKHWRK